MEVEKAVVRSVISKCRARDIDLLLRKWGWFSDEDMKKLNFKATKKVIASQITALCQESGLKQEIGDLDLLCTQLYSSSRKWTVLKLKGSQPKTDLDPQELQDRLISLLEPESIYSVHVNVKSYAGATWVRLYRSEGGPYRVGDVIYILAYPHTPFLIISRMKVKMQEMLYSVLLEVFEAEEIKHLQLTGYHLSSLADLALQQNSQGPFHTYRDREAEENPLVSSKSRKRKGSRDDAHDAEREMDLRLRDEHLAEKRRRKEKLDSTFGSHVQPTLEKLEYKLDLRFRGTTFAPGMKGRRELFRCRVKFEGPSVLEGTKNLAKTGLATLPMPKHLARVHSLAKNHFTIAEMDSSKK